MFGLDGLPRPSVNERDDLGVCTQATTGGLSFREEPAWSVRFGLLGVKVEMSTMNVTGDDEVFGRSS